MVCLKNTKEVYCFQVHNFSLMGVSENVLMFHLADAIPFYQHL